LTSVIAAADRRFEVRRAIAAWRKAGLVEAADDPRLAAYADDRIRTSPIFRALFFVFTWFGFATAFGFAIAFVAAAGMSWESGAGFATLHLLAGAAMLVLAEVLTGARRLRRFGIEEACAWIGGSYLLGGGLWLLATERTVDFDRLLIAGAWAAAALATLIAWRWATPGTGAVAALALFVALSQLPANHLVCLLVSGLFAAPLALRSVGAPIPPEHRRRFGEAFAVVVLAFYAAIHVNVVEERLFRLVRLGEGGNLSSGGGKVSPALLAASLVAMVAVPALLLVVGLRRRFRPAIDLGLLLAGATGATFTVRWQPAPLWLRLTLEGAGLCALALLLRRALARRAGAEWRGLTALALAEDRESVQALEVAATLAALSPAARQVGSNGLVGGGGEFGGGGASAKF